MAICLDVWMVYGLMTMLLCGYIIRAIWLNGYDFKALLLCPLFYSQLGFYQIKTVSNQISNYISLVQGAAAYYLECL